MSLRSYGVVVSVAMMGMILVCVRQALAASNATTTTAETIQPSSADLNPYYDWSFEGKENGDELGWSVSGAGDVNGDGADDIIFGAPMYTRDTPDVEDREGVAFVFLGDDQGLRLTPDWVMGSGLQGSRFGNAVSSAGDVNGDGYDDVIIGAEGYKVDFGINGVPQSGAVFLYYGSPEGPGEILAWKVEAEAPKIALGHAVSDAGDINGDGYDDVIVGAPAYESESEQDNEGKVYLYLGSPSGLGSTPDWTYEGNQTTASCGDSLGSAGDVNGDGFDDVILGAPNFDGDFDQEGSAYVFLGSPTGLSDEPDWSIRGNQIGSKLGASVAGAGDVNGDGYDEIMVGAPHYSLAEALNIGAVFVYYGSPAGLSHTPDWATYGSELESLTMFGAAVHGAGDIDHDGYGDVIIGAYQFGIYSPSGEDKPDEGAAYLYKGSPTGLEAQPDWMAFGGKAEAWFGYSVGAAGDVNGDELDDIIVGAPKYKMDQRDVLGSVLVYYAQETAQEYSVFLPLVAYQDGE